MGVPGVGRNEEKFYSQEPFYYSESSEKRSNLDGRSPLFLQTFLTYLTRILTQGSSLQDPPKRTLTNLTRTLTQGASLPEPPKGTLSYLTRTQGASPRNPRTGP